MVVLEFCFFQLIFLCKYSSVRSESAVLQKSVLNLGFHRLLSYRVIIPNVSGVTCLLIEENLPPDIYVDPYQLADELRNGQIQIVSSEEINTESPAYEAKPIIFKAFSKSKDNIHKLDIPIHLRYQKPQSCSIFGEKVAVNFGKSNLYFNETTKDDSNNACLSAETISWRHLETEANDVKLELPVGCIEHFYVVFSLTVCLILMSSLMFCRQLMKKNTVM